ncbi:MAG: hypothetical protein A2W91_10120 [Bacteroidetes bacterium GWF2_38_335]|nr:MAG: hypothetical protein A2W91_10120 [Bacteroidetes bacterium GWF2_38_335]HBS88020.1 hypothetical protein [Bacteroidales bacterium]
MRTFFILYIILWFFQEIPAQSGIADTSPAAANFIENKYILEYNTESFFNTGLANNQIEYLTFDQELLNATIFFSINKLRKKSRKSELKYNSVLDSLSSQYVANNNAYKFKRSSYNIKNISKFLFIEFKKNNNRFSLFSANINILQILKYTNNRRFYYDKTDTSKTYKLYYTPTYKDSDTIGVQIDPHTYKSFSELYLRSVQGYERRKLLSNSFCYVSCNTEVVEHSLDRKKIPFAKVLIVLGGFRIPEIKKK